MVFKTNYNQKMACNTFLHVDVAPPAGVPESKLANTVFDIVTTDASHPPIRAKLVDMARFELYNMRDLVAYASHGMASIELCSYFINLGNHLTTPMAAYVYQKIEDPKP